MKACAFASACVCARTRALLMDSCGFVRARLRLYLRLRAGGFPCAHACARVHMSSQRRELCDAVAVQRALCHHSLGGEPARSSAPGTAPLCYVSAFRASSVCAFSAATDYRQCRCAAVPLRSRAKLVRARSHSRRFIMHRHRRPSAFPTGTVVHDRCDGCDSPAIRQEDLYKIVKGIRTSLLRYCA